MFEADDRDALRARLRALLRRPPRHDKLGDVMGVREFKKRHAEACKLADKPAATVQQLISAVESIRYYVGTEA